MVRYPGTSNSTKLLTLLTPLGLNGTGDWLRTRAIEGCGNLQGDLDRICSHKNVQTWLEALRPLKLLNLPTPILTQGPENFSHSSLIWLQEFSLNVRFFSHIRWIVDISKPGFSRHRYLKPPSLPQRIKKQLFLSHAHPKPHLLMPFEYC